MIAAEAEPEKYADLVENMDETATVVRVPQKKRTAARCVKKAGGCERLVGRLFHHGLPAPG